MVVALFGDSCTGKSTIAERLAQQLSVQVYSGKDYLKLAKSESICFVERLRAKSAKYIPGERQLQ